VEQVAVWALGREALKMALKRLKAPGTSVTESELVQVARVVVVGSGNEVNLAGPQPPERIDTAVREVVMQAFQLVAEVPDLVLVYAHAPDGETRIEVRHADRRSVSVDRLLLDVEAIEPPRPAPRAELLQRPRPGRNELVERMPSEAAPTRATAQELADEARRLLEMTDDR
jgi:hypothetical protein